MIFKEACPHCKTVNTRRRITDRTQIKCVNCNAICVYNENGWSWFSSLKVLRKWIEKNVK
jgi:hypothetical protein